MHILMALLSAASVLHGWDARREHAWAASDPAALRALYVPGSVAATRDVRLLRAYDERGLVVRRIVTQVFALQVVDSSRRRITINVVDRVAGGVVGDAVGNRPLGSTPPSARLIRFRRVDGVWRVVSVTERAPREAQPRRRDH